MQKQITLHSLKEKGKEGVRNKSCAERARLSPGPDMSSGRESDLEPLKQAPLASQSTHRISATSAELLENLPAFRHPHWLCKNDIDRKLATEAQGSERVAVPASPSCERKSPATVSMWKEGGPHARGLFLLFALGLQHSDDVLICKESFCFLCNAGSCYPLEEK